jgi:hypothetical protein
VDTLADIRLGTSAFTASGWEGSFYPRGLKPADRLTFYAGHFDTVEVDSTFYACPLPQTVNRLIGRISLMNHESNNNRGFWIGLPWQRQGLMTEACEAVTDNWFDVLNFAVLRAPKAVENTASRRISEKSRMRIIGTKHLVDDPSDDGEGVQSFQTGLDVVHSETDLLPQDRARKSGSPDDLPIRRSPCLRRHSDQNLSGFRRTDHFPQECDARSTSTVLGFQAYMKAQTVN